MNPGPTGGSQFGPILADVPAHWKIVPLKRVLLLNQGGAWGQEPKSDSDPRVLRSTDQTVLGEWALDDPPRRHLSSAELDSTLLLAGDLLVTKSSGSERHIGKTTLVTDDIAVEKCGFSNFMQRLRVNRSLDSRFAWYLLNSSFARGQLCVLSNSTTGLANLSGEVLGDMVLPLPPREEQSALVRMLDHEVKRVDSLIAEQRRLMELLKEKRQAVISHTVTKGLDADIPTQPSGSAWLQQVPVEWRVVALRRIIVAIEQGWSPECIARPAELGEWGVLRAGCLNGGIFDPEDNKALPPELPPMPEYEVKPGDILMSRASGSPEFVGSTAVVAEARPRLMLSDKLFRLKLAVDVDPRFFVAFMGSRLMRAQIERAISGADGLANNLPQSALRSMLICLPPLDEQVRIARFIAEESCRLDELWKAAELAIELLAERRAALISAAVTGQIDVRGLVPQEASA